jgi:hypothetical protein
MNEPRHDCIWDVLGVIQPIIPYIPPHPRGPQPDPIFTIVLVKCRYCNTIMTFRLEGTWDEDKIKGEVSGDNITTAD